MWGLIGRIPPKPRAIVLALIAIAATVYGLPKAIASTPDCGLDGTMSRGDLCIGGGDTMDYDEALADEHKTGYIALGVAALLLVIAVYVFVKANKKDDTVAPTPAV